MWRTVWLCICLSALGRCEDAPSTVISQGRLRGAFLTTRGGRQISAFQGIPFAAPPVGLLRFHKPLPPASWAGELNATLPGSPCLQANFTGEVFGSEDCLFINVYTHKVSKESLSPVMVFIHGGGFQAGSGDLYQPDFLMDKDIVLVTVNYRLGPLGFLSLEDKELPGNNGLKDQRAALKWVQENIAQFGGDPASVTLVGESAGAASVHLHLLSESSKGLFHKGVIQSGSAYCPWAVQAPGQARAASERFTANLGCNHPSSLDVLTCLRDMPGYVLIDVGSQLYEWQMDPIITFPPVIEPADTEDAFLTADPWTLSSDVPLIAGVNSAEGAFKVNLFQKENIVELNDDFEIIGPLTLLFRSTAEDPVRVAFSIKKFYFLDGDIKPDNFEGLTNMYSDSWFIYPALETVRRHRGPKYLYYFDYRGANSVVPQYSGVSHIDDLQYFVPMNTSLLFRNYNHSTEDQEVSEKLIDLWTTFVIHGSPSINGSDVAWSEAGTGSEYLHMKKNDFVMGRELLKERDQFWIDLPYRNKFLSEAGVPQKDEL